MHNYNCPDCNEAKLQTDKNARKINEVIDQVNALIQVNNETVDFIEEKANEVVEEIAEIKVNEVIDDLNTEIDNINSSLEHIATIWTKDTDMSKYVDYLIIPKGEHETDLDISNVGRLRCDGTIKGNVTIKTTKYKIIERLRCDEFNISGVWHCNFNNIVCNTININGYTMDWGTIYNTLSDIKCNSLNVSVESSFVNCNNFTNMVTQLMTTIGDKDFHGNVFDTCDFTGTGIQRNDTRNQGNTLINYYSEGKSTINGNWSILGSATPYTPKADIDSNILGSVGNYSGNYSDFLSCSENIAIGGQWEEVRETGQPKCMFITNGAFEIVEDTTSPDGSNRRMDISSNGTWSTVGISFPKLISKGSFTLFSKNNNLTIIAKVNNNNDIYNITSVIEVGDGWYLYRGVLPKNSTQINILLTTSSNSVVTIGLGGFYVSRYKTCLLPTFKPSRIRGVGTTYPQKGMYELGDMFLNKESWSSSNVGWIWNGLNWKSY